MSAEANKINAKLKFILKEYEGAINAKALLKRAGKLTLETMKNKVPVDTGRLRDSLAFLNFKRDPMAIYVGARYRSPKDQDGNDKRPTGRHAHLVEYGFIDRSGKKVEGTPFVKQTYEATAQPTLKALENELERFHSKMEKRL